MPVAACGWLVYSCVLTNIVTFQNFKLLLTLSTSLLCSHSSYTKGVFILFYTTFNIIQSRSLQYQHIQPEKCIWNWIDTQQQSQQKLNCKLTFILHEVLLYRCFYFCDHSACMAEEPTVANCAQLCICFHKKHIIGVTGFL